MKLTALDKLVQQGDFISAVNQYFADNVIARYGQEDVVEGKVHKIRGLEYFMDVVDTVNAITLHETAIKDTETFSLYTFDFTQKGGRQLLWFEVIRRVWNGTAVIEEEYMIAETADAAKLLFDQLAPKSATANPKVATAKKDSAVKTTKAATKKVAKKATKTAKKVTKKAKNGADDLKKIEGVGPKIAQLLTDGGYETFKKVAQALPSELKAVLENAGSRYRMHNPETWPQQAELAAAGKWEALKKWQDELKGGKKA
ncbi:MAG: hypothetical protein AAGK47_08415 [Bacteroidota bacterium]